MTRSERTVCAVVLFAVLALLLGTVAFAQTTPPPGAIRVDEPRVTFRIGPPELHPPDLRDDSHEAALRALAEPAEDDAELRAVDNIGRNLFLAALLSIGLVTVIYGLGCALHPAGRAGWSAVLLVSALALQGCAQFPVRGKVCYVDARGNQVCVGSDGTGVTIEGDLRGAPRNLEGFAK